MRPIVGTVLAFALASSACATTPLDFEMSSDYVVGEGAVRKAEACAYYFLGFIPAGGDGSTAAALAKVMKDQRRSQLTMVTLDVRETFYFLATEYCTIATATFVPDKQDGPRIPDRDYDD